MTKISRITVQKRNKERLNIFLMKDGQESFGFAIDQDVFVKYNLKKGMDINEEHMKELIEEDEKKKTLQLSFHYLSYRMRTIHEMQTYLEKKERDPAHIEAAIKQLQKLGYLNDHEFASAYVKSKSTSQIKGPLKLKQELQQKGVGQAVTEQAVEEFHEEDEKTLIQKWVDKQAKKAAKDSHSAHKRKLYTQLKAKGFSSALIQSVLEEMTMPEEEDENQALYYQAEKLQRKYSSKYTGKEFTLKMKQALYQKGFSVQLIDRYLEEAIQEES
ncbi:recombination regulator RecX [Alkalicoccobacillus porphyridii]|uniref:Regulatory protein RecX n=1 Tax=Alkalicoccobacillus porphyridii TaxID=2597270 RepID=A0A553ZUN7_9BACI|nr:recombination regulator RecX [Alkalicoccobacillus porphyridii]TSB45200.1 recombination regulator RecX [Alkalicoccobacillus porphyridii]